MCQVQRQLQEQTLSNERAALMTEKEEMQAARDQAQIVARRELEQQTALQQEAARAQVRGQGEGGDEVGWVEVRREVEVAYESA